MGFDQKRGVKRGKNGKNERKKGPGETGNVKGSFWTACSYCYYKFEYEKKYEECRLRCRNCRKGFHAVVVSPPPEGLAVKYSSGNSSMGDKKETRRRGKGKRHDVVEISDSDDEKKELGVKIEANKVKAEGFNNSEVLLEENLSSPMVRLKQMDKASVLGETVRQVRELKNRVKEMKGASNGSLECVLPLEQDIQQHLRRYRASISTIDFSFKSLKKVTKPKAEANIANAQKHKTAERHRRKRISRQFDMLRTILPNLIKVSDEEIT
ncbi:hypothetical protein GOBAR_DD07884 [Gossypium barbadense]|nr:hypothetical protein GOBAR_DD07884 [Gossypium barbadense]